MDREAIKKAHDEYLLDTLRILSSQYRKETLERHMLEKMKEEEKHKQQRYDEESGILELIDSQGEYQRIVYFWNGSTIDT